MTSANLEWLTLRKHLIKRGRLPNPSILHGTVHTYIKYSFIYWR